jgi:DNA-binding beta-propeller fold protein YncE
MGGQFRVAVCVLALLLAWAPAATALSGYYGGAPRDDVGGRFSAPNDVAVYVGDPATVDDDKLFVVEADADNGQANGRVQRLARDGGFELMWGKDVVRAGASGDTGKGYEICTRATSCKAGLHGDREGEFLQPTGIAVSQATGHVYVNDRANQRVQEFDVDGDFVRAWGWGVDTGAAQFEICAAGCRAGRVDGAYKNYNPGQLGLASGSSIAVRPAPPYDVWVADVANHRVLQFEPDGDFLRAWGWGVDTGAPAFESCSALSGCREGVVFGDDGGFSPSGYPRHLTVGVDGVVYGSDSGGPNRIVRFAPDRSPIAGDARRARLKSLASIGSDGHDRSLWLLSSGTTAGIEIDPASGHLLAVRDGFNVEPTVIDEVADPGAHSDASSDSRPRIVAEHAIPEDARVKNLSPAYGESLYLLAAAGIPPGLGIPTVRCSLPRSAQGCDGVMAIRLADGPFEAVFGIPPVTGPLLSRQLVSLAR